MVLDTKSKKFNFSLPVKIVAIILSLIMMGSSVLLLFNSFQVVAFYNDTSLLFENKKISYAKSLYFNEQFGDDISSVSNYYSYDDSYYKFLENSKAGIIKEAEILFEKYFKMYNSAPVDDDEDNFLFEFKKTLKFKDNEFEFAFQSDNTYYDSVIDVLSNDLEGEIREQSGMVEYLSAKKNIEGFKNFKYCVCDKSGKVLATNMDAKDAKKEILSSPTYFWSNYGKIKSKNVFFDDYKATYNCSYSLNAYFAIDPTLAENDEYLEIANYASSVQSSNTAAMFFGGLILFALSLATAIFVFVNCGRKNGYKGIKLAFIDYVPLDLHLILSAGLTVLAGMGGVLILKEYYSSLDYTFNLTMREIKLLTLVFALLATACYALFEEFICSLVRTIKAKAKPFWKNFLILKIIAWIFKLIKKIIKKIVTAFSYKPKNYKKNVVALGIIYALFNLVIFIILCCSDIAHAPFTVVFFIAIFALNMFFDYKACKYIINLDMIIDCAKNREYYSGQIEKLPASLKTLAESLKYTNDELQIAVTKAVKDERLKAELITNVSHDLKTPLTSIITYVDLLSKCDINDENAKKYIAVLDEKGAKLKRLIEDLIEASKVESGNITLNMVNLNLSELSAQAVGESGSDFEKENLEMIYKESTNSVNIFADGAKTFRVIENLLSNAKKYSATGSRIYTSVYEENGYGVFEIKNISAQALDISPEELTERFVRGDKSRTKSGNGLGLSIAKELCKAQGGELEIIIDGDMFKAKAKFSISEK